MNGKLPAKTLALWRIRLTAVFLLLLGAFTPFLRLFFLIAAPFYIITMLWYLPKLHKSFLIQKSQNQVYLRYGIFFKRQKLLLLKEKPIISSFSTPLCRIMQLENLCFKTANGWFLLPETEYNGRSQNV